MGLRMEADRDAIAALIHRYAELLDAGDLEGVARLFTGATFRSNQRPEPRQGSDAVLAVLRTSVALYDGSPCTKHVTTNLVIDVDPSEGTGSARSYFTVLQARPELPLQVIIAGRYHDRFARLDGTWRFTDRMVHVDLAGDLRFHLKRHPIGS
jgi:3-phenylpropionate/cinnamic acid dioxygenase small subunit